MKSKIILDTVALLTVSILFLTSTACNSLSNARISADKATTIASRYVPPDLLVHAEISYTTFPLYAKKPDAWVIFFDFHKSNVVVTSQELVKFSWARGECQPPDDSYWQISISVDSRTGKINYKVATDALYLGGPLSVKPPPNYTLFIWAAVIVIDGFGILMLIWLWRRERRYKKLE